ncbi:MAG TPA: 30S ribosomal protein S2 [Sedimentisphaerales bacterium]|nr:30S ribosomal protein S2 [Sedimentisphaerales bacterium]
MAKTLARELISAGVHFGHGVSRWNPKMAPFIYTKRGKIHIIDVRKTLAGLLIARQLLMKVVASGKDVVFVGTKRQAQKTVEAAAKKCGMHYVSQRWLGGTLTNFRTIRSRLQRLEQLEAMAESGALENESKKQASRLKRQMRKIKGNLEGIRRMSQLPGAVVVVDVRKEYLALREAAKLGIARIGIIDTDSDPDTVDVAIPANDDSIRAVDLMINELADAVAAGKTMTGGSEAAGAQARTAGRRARSTRPVLASAHEQEPESTPAAEMVPDEGEKPILEKSPDSADSTDRSAETENAEPAQG